MNKSTKVCDFFIGLSLFSFAAACIFLMFASAKKDCDERNSFKYRIVIGSTGSGMSYYSNEFDRTNKSFINGQNTNQIVTLDKLNYYIIQQHL